MQVKPAIADACEVLQDFGATTRQMIASCSKWYSASLVVTFVEEGKLSLQYAAGKDGVWGYGFGE